MQEVIKEILDYVLQSEGDVWGNNDTGYTYRMAGRIIDIIRHEIMSIQYTHPCGQCDHKDNHVNMYCPECRALENYRNKILEALWPQVK